MPGLLFNLPNAHGHIVHTVKLEQVKMHMERPRSDQYLASVPDVVLVDVAEPRP
jgi:hypothetical protein